MWLTNRRPSVLLWRCLLGHLTRKIVSEIAYNVSRGTLNSTIPYHLEGLRLVSAISARELIGHGSLWLFVYLRFRSTLTYLFTYFYPPLGTLGIRDSASGPSWKFLPHSSQAPPPWSTPSSRCHLRTQFIRPWSLRSGCPLCRSPWQTNVITHRIKL